MATQLAEGFTAGPWQISHQSNTIKQVGGPVLMDLNGVRIGDANLIVAAPELFDALTGLLAAIDGPDEFGGTNWTERLRQKQNAARAAIAKVWCGQ